MIDPPSSGGSASVSAVRASLLARLRFRSDRGAAPPLPNAGQCGTPDRPAAPRLRRSP
ncbi:hypothetical protein AvCA_17450 [Azotobacter vinelandii CA]|uniref:Uncharacterized protein n=2 Tax=Azotobacter vinelandii TaxID=354 RepID=C1DSK3_AZOVD|nr:hypothetical protein Avin_17450 [Azotobacter vinelandii DJ]AGK15196.1 hypothetical protein AvCA_17450 [Azotobacter vinelandii CA]AGK20122.1 hypothetical protein AvCA6_17450 [Azotobacter vinelandii CA6]